MLDLEELLRKPQLKGWGESSFRLLKGRRRRLELLELKEGLI
jgi:hypothetical protein